MIDRARKRLFAEVEAVFAEERARFEGLVRPSAELRELAGELRGSVRDVAGPTA
jgi:hypothetical protein